MSEQLASMLDFAQLVRYDADNRMVIAWYGGLTFRVFHDSGREVGLWSYGGEEPLTAALAGEEINEAIADGSYLYYVDAERVG